MSKSNKNNKNAQPFIKTVLAPRKMLSLNTLQRLVKMKQLEAKQKFQTNQPQPKFALPNRYQDLRRTFSSHRGGKYRPAHVRGKGDYFTDAVDFGKKAWDVADKDVESKGTVNKIAKDIGNVVGGTFGVGRQVGNALSYFSRVLGFGDYKLKNNGIHDKFLGHGVHANSKSKIKYNSFLTNSPPTFSGAEGEDCVLSKRELIGNVHAANIFTSNTYILNPGNDVFFPWISRVADGYEEFQIMGALIEYKEFSSNYTPGVGLGAVAMAIDYDCLDDNFKNTRAMGNAEGGDVQTPDTSFIIPVECDPSRNVLKRMYVVPGINDVTKLPGDARLSTLGTVTVGVEGMDPNVSTTTIIGELWVTYKIKLSRPIVEPDSVLNNYSQHITGSTMINSDMATITILGDTTSGGDALTVSSFSAQYSNGRCNVQLTNKTLHTYRVFTYCQAKQTSLIGTPFIRQFVPSDISIRLGSGTTYLTGDTQTLGNISADSIMAFGSSTSGMNVVYPADDTATNASPSQYFAGAAVVIPPGCELTMFVPGVTADASLCFWDIRVFSFPDATITENRITRTIRKIQEDVSLARLNNSKLMSTLSNPRSDLKTKTRTPNPASKTKKQIAKLWRDIVVEQEIEPEKQETNTENEVVNAEEEEDDDTSTSSSITLDDDWTEEDFIEYRRWRSNNSKPKTSTKN